MNAYNIFTKEMIVKKTFRVYANSQIEAVQKFFDLGYNCGESLGEDNLGKWGVEKILKVENLRDIDIKKMEKLKGGSKT